MDLPEEVSYKTGSVRFQILSHNLFGPLIWNGLPAGEKTIETGVLSLTGTTYSEHT